MILQDVLELLQDQDPLGNAHNASDFLELVRLYNKGCALAATGGVDIIVNNAGYVWNSAIHNHSDEQWEAMLAMHATAPFRLLRAFGRWLREQPYRTVREEVDAYMGVDLEGLGRLLVEYPLEGGMLVSVGPADLALPRLS